MSPGVRTSVLSPPPLLPQNRAPCRPDPIEQHAPPCVRLGSGAGGGWPISVSRGGGGGTDVPTPGDMEEIGHPPPAPAYAAENRANNAAHNLRDARSGGDRDGRSRLHRRRRRLRGLRRRGRAERGPDSA